MQLTRLQLKKARGKMLVWCVGVLVFVVLVFVVLVFGVLVFGVLVLVCLWGCAIVHTSSAIQCGCSQTFQLFFPSTLGEDIPYMKICGRRVIWD